MSVSLNASLRRLDGGGSNDLESSSCTYGVRTATTVRPLLTTYRSSGGRSVPLHSTAPRLHSQDPLGSSRAAPARHHPQLSPGSGTIPGNVSIVAPFRRAAIECGRPPCHVSVPCRNCRSQNWCFKGTVGGSTYLYERAHKLWASLRADTLGCTHGCMSGPDDDERLRSPCRPRHAPLSFSAAAAILAFCP